MARRILSWATKVVGPVSCSIMYFALWLAVFALVQKFLDIIGIPGNRNTLTLNNLRAALMSSFITIGSLTLLAISWTWLHRKPLRSVGFDNQFQTLWPGLGLAVLGNVVAYALLRSAGWLIIMEIRPISPALIGVSLLFLKALGASVNEEIVFRGVFYSISERHWPQWITAIVSSAGFAWLHVWQNVVDHWGLLIFLFVGGLLFAWARSIHNSLWLPIGLHFGFDFTEWVLNLVANEPLSPFVTSVKGPFWAVGEASITSWMSLFIAGSGLLLYTLHQKYVQK